MTVLVARLIVPLALALTSVLLAAPVPEDKKPIAPKEKDVAYTAIYLGDHPLVLPLEGNERRARHVRLTGTLGGKGYLTADWNPGAFSTFGDGIPLSNVLVAPWEVELKPLAIQDPEKRNRLIYEISGTPVTGVSLRLVVPTQPGDSPRLLVVGGKDGNTIQRVITLENITPLPK